MLFIDKAQVPVAISCAVGSLTFENFGAEVRRFIIRFLTFILYFKSGCILFVQLLVGTFCHKQDLMICLLKLC
jgi:hypothetical protein